MEAEIASPRKHKRGREDAELSKRRKHHGHGHGHSHSHGHGDGRSKSKDHERHHHKHKRRRSHSRSRHARVSETSPARVCKDDMEEGEIVDEDDSGFESGEIQPEQPTASPKRESEKVKHARRSSKGVSSQDSSAKDTEPFAKALAVDVLGESPSIDIEEKGNSNSLDDTDGLARQGRNPCNTVSDDRYGDNVKHSEVQENGLDFKGKRKHSTSGLQEDGREKHRMRTESTPGLQEDGREKHRVRTELHLTSTGSERERRSSQLDPRLPPKSSETWKRSINPDEDRDRHERHSREEDKHARHRDSHKDVDARSDLERDRYRANSTSNSGLERHVPDADKNRLQSSKHHKGSEIKTNGSDESFAEKTNQIQKNDPFDITSKCYDIGKEERTDRKLKEERTDRELSPSYKYHDRHSARNVYKDKELYKEKDRKRHSHSQERSRAYDDKPKRSRSGERSRPYHDKPKRSRSRERAGSNREYRSRSRDRAGNSRQHRSRSRDQARHIREHRSRSHDRRAGHIIDHRSRSYDRERREYVYSSRHRRSNSRSRGGRHENRMGDRNYNYSHRKESDIIQEKGTHSLMDKERKEDGLNDEDRPADSENQEEYQFAEQEEDDVEKIKEESRKRRQAILEKYRQLNHTAHNVTSVSEVTEGEVNVKGAAVIPGNMASQQEQTNVTCPGSQDENDMFASESTFSISKEKIENGKPPVEIKDSENGLGKGSPKGETSGDVFYDDIFGESPAGVCKTGKCDGKPVDTSGLNDNWDDGEGYYCYRIGEVLDGRFEILASQGKGVFSSVVRAKNLKPAKGEPEEVAIKIIRNNETMYKAGQEELIILKKLACSDPDDKRHCVKFISSFKYRNHLCLVFESLHMNLREVLKKFGRDVGLNLTAVRAYAKQMFIALKHLKNCGVLHCDIKPDNILVNEAKKVLKLCDFGNAMFAGKNEITPYLVSRFYRAPEIIIGLPYDHALDIWSVGCCLFELYVGKVLFPGPSNNDMLRLHMELKGPFPKKMLRKAAFSDQHFDQDFNFHSNEEDPVTKKMVKRLLPNIKHKDINSLITRFSGEDPKMMANFKDLLDKIFTLDPDKRITVSQALSHPFITGK